MGPNLDEIGDEDLTVFASASASPGPDVDYVFLHGLNGNPRHLQDIPGSRVTIYEYNADFEWALVQNKTTIKAIAQKFVNRLIDERDGEFKDRPLVMIAHSLGGLIIKQALVSIHKDRSSGRSGRMIEEQNAIYDSVSGLVFMGTPHAGSRIEELNRIKMLKLLGKAISISYPEKLVKTLSAQSDGLVDLSEDFEKTTIFIKHEIEICTYYETKTMAGLGSEEIVPLTAAWLHYENERKEGIAASHTEMVKFPKAKDGMYRSIMKRLASMGEDGLKLKEARRVLNRFSISIEDISTTSVLEAVTRSADTLRACQWALARCHMVDLSVASLHTECSTIRFQLSPIEKLTSRNANRFEEYVLDEYQSLLEACSISFFVLNKNFDALRLTSVADMTQDTVVEQVKRIWEHRQMEIVSQSIIGQARAIGVLFHAFTSEDPKRMSEIMQSSEAQDALKIVSSDVVSLHESFQTAPTHMDDVESIAESVLGDEASEFDAILINTTLYKKAFQRRIKAQKQAAREGEELKETAPALPNTSFEPGSSLKVRSPIDPEGPSQELDAIYPWAPESSGESISNSQGDFSNAGLWTNLDHKDLEHRASVDFQSSAGTVRARTAKMRAEDEWSLGSFWDPTQSHTSNQDLTLVSRKVASPQMLNGSRESDKKTPPSPLYMPDGAKLNRQPCLMDVLTGQSLKPYTLYEFYVYMRGIQNSVHHLDFWLDVAYHKYLCRYYVRGLSRAQLVDIGNRNLFRPMRASLPRSSNGNLPATSLTPATKDETDQDANLSTFLREQTMARALQSERTKFDKTNKHLNSVEPPSVARQEIRANAEKMLYTFILPGADREIYLPVTITTSMTLAIEEAGRDDPEVFEEALDYVYQAMEREAFPGFLNLSRPLLRVFRGSKTLGTLVNKLSGRDVPAPAKFSDNSRISPEELFGAAWLAKKL